MLLVFLSFSNSLSCLNENISQVRSYLNTESFSVLGCLFSRLQSFGGNGGVICGSVSGLVIGIIYCSFYNCAFDSSSNIFGGAIYFLYKSSYLSFICANKCSSSYVGQFAYISCSNDNSVQYLSLSNSFRKMYPLEQVNGLQTVYGSNSSINNNEWGTGFLLSSSTNSTLSYCTASNNVATSSICIEFHVITNSNARMNNIIHNNSPSSYGVILLHSTSTVSIDSCIMMNNRNTLLYVHSGHLTCTNNFINHQFTLTSGSVSGSQNLYPNTTTLFSLKHYSSFYCHAENIINPDQTGIVRFSKLFNQLIVFSNGIIQ